MTVVLKCAKMVARKRAEENPTGGFKVKVNGRSEIVKFTDLVEALRDIEHKIEAGQLQYVPTCETCKRIDFAEHDEKAQCWPKEYTSWRKRTDHCSLHCRR